jgi:SEFIR domain
MAPESPSPRVLISYSHDSTQHEARVLALATRLREDGVDAILDQYETFPRQGWIQWMNQQLEQAHFVLLVCTETYFRSSTGKAESGKGLGASYEAQLIQQLLYNSDGVNEKFIPVLLSDTDRGYIPIQLQRYQSFLASDNAGYEDLYRLLTDQPKAKKPELGRLPALEVPEAKPDFRNFLASVKR